MRKEKNTNVTKLGKNKLNYFSVCISIVYCIVYLYLVHGNRLHTILKNWLAQLYLACITAGRNFMFIWTNFSSVLIKVEPP